MHIKKGDNVVIIGGDEKGKRGKILKIFSKKERVIVEGVNFMKKHYRSRKSGEQSRMIEREAPIHVSSIALLCPRCGKKTRVGKLRLQDGRSARQCKKCNEMLEE